MASMKKAAMPIRPLRSKADYEAALDAVETYFDNEPKPGTPEADRFDAKALKNLGRRLLDVVAPDQADAHEAAILEREERDAAASQRLTM